MGKDKQDAHDPFTESGALEAGRLAYQAYGAAVRFRNFQGDPMPDWGSLSDDIQRGWTEAAKAVAAKVLMAAVGGLGKPSVPHQITRKQEF